jgi:hypothetical protein
MKNTMPWTKSSLLLFPNLGRPEAIGSSSGKKYQAMRLLAKILILLYDKLVLKLRFWNSL